MSEQNHLDVCRGCVYFLGVADNAEIPHNVGRHLCGCVNGRYDSGAHARYIDELAMCPCAKWDNNKENMSATKITTPARLIDSEELHLSQYGNPRAKLWLELADGSHVIAQTARDAAAGYCVGNWRCAKTRGLPWVVITYHITRGGSVIVDYIHESRGYTTAAAELDRKGAH